jgi:transmembrane sensor
MSDEGEKQGAGTSRPDMALSDQAIDWLLLMASGRATARDRLAFLNWRRQSAEHEAAVTAAEALMQAVGETRQAEAHRRSVEQARNPVAVRRRVRRRLLFAGAAAAASVAAVTAALPALGPFAALYADHATGVGQRKRGELADGSVALLNTATAISVDFSTTERRIVLHDGEAWFDVTKDPNRPFIVVTADIQARAVGTAFAVRRKNDGENVTVTEGTVEVRVQGGEPIRVVGGQRLEVGEGDRLKLSAVDVDTATAWQRGKLIFNRRPLQSVVEELQRYSARRIVIIGDRLRTLEVTGVFDLDDPARVLRAVAETTKASVVDMPLLTVVR